MDSHPESGSTDSMVEQYALLVEQKYAVYDILVNAGRHLDNKANSLLQAGSFIIALAAAAGISGFAPTQYSGWAMVGAGVAVAAFVVMIILSLGAWSPSTYEVPGITSDWDLLFTDYMHQDIGDCNAQVLRDLYCAIRSIKKRNTTKIRLVQISTGLLAAQVLGIAWFAVLS